jgi:hypothetical protein
MNILERSAMRRAEKRLAPLMDRSERMLDFDIGTTPSGQRADVMVSTKALYVAPNGMNPVRVDYTDIAAIEGRPQWIHLRTLSGAELRVDFGRANRNLIEILLDQYRPVASRMKTRHVGWGQGFGAKFLIVDDKIDSWCYDHGTPDDLTTSMITQQAHGELAVDLGIEPDLGYENPRPIWMPEFEWTPPLTTATPHAPPRDDEDGVDRREFADEFDDEDFEDGPDGRPY